MRPFFILLAFSFIILTGCSNSAFVQTSKANETMARMNRLQRGMPANHVRSLLGSPRKIGNKKAYGRTYTVWYYVTQGVVFAQLNYYQLNFTPLVFYKGRLFGWGKAFYYNLFRPKTHTLGTRGGEKNTIYYYKEKDQETPSDKTIDEILEELHEEKTFRPLDWEEKEKKPAEEKKQSEDNSSPEKKEKSAEDFPEQQSLPEEEGSYQQAPSFWE